MSWFAISVYNLTKRLALVLSKRRVVLGIRVYAFIDIEQRDEVILRVQQALECLAHFNEAPLRRARNDLRLIWVRHLPEALGQYDAGLRACELDSKHVLDPESTAESLASTIVHEATHARIRSCGIRSTDLSRARIERACRKAQLAFAVRLPNADPVIAQVTPWDNVPDEYWDSSAIVRRAGKEHLKALKELEAPRWFVKALRRLVARRLRSNRGNVTRG